MPELSVIVPILNEEEQLPRLFATLSSQEQVRLELILSDGGSSDRSSQVAKRLAAGAPFPVQVIQGKRGRGGQLNRAAAVSRAAQFLFLHVDSFFPEPYALQTALKALATAQAVRGESMVAGHFPLEFQFPGATPAPYRFYAAKACLDRPGCTHGDQGFLMSRGCFERVGPFHESPPFLEDTFLAERVRSLASWILLPCRIQTSPRRFLSEGLLPRQTLNAILMTLASIERVDLLNELRLSYPPQGEAQRLRLGRFLAALRRRITQLPAAERRRVWRLTGSYLRSQAWQIAFLVDHLFEERRDGKGGRFLALHDRFWDPVTDHAAGRCAATALVWGWFQAAALISQLH